MLEKRLIVNALLELDYSGINMDSDIVNRVEFKLEIHDLAVSKENVSFILSEYGEEVTNPMKSVRFDEEMS